MFAEKNFMKGKAVLAAAAGGCLVLLAVGLLAIREDAGAPSILAIPQTWFFALYLLPILLMFAIRLAWRRFGRMSRR